MRAYIGQRDNWAQIRVGICALLLPPLILGAAFYSMLATQDEGAARHPGAAAKAEVVRSELVRDRSAEEMARASDSVPVPVTVMPAAGVNPPSPGEMDAAQGPPAVQPSWPAPAEASTALLPRALIPAGKVPPQTPPRTITQASAAQAPSAADPAAGEGPPAASAAPASMTHKHARSEAPASRRNAQHRQEFSLKNWLQQLGVLPRNARG
jgi:hypothetical protein